MNWSVLKKIISNYQYLLKALLSLFFLWALIQILFSKKQYLEKIQWSTFVDNWYWIPVLLVLVIVNWSMEAKKWEIITRNNSFIESLRVVLIGLLFKQFIPLGIGELSGRVLADEKTAKKEATGAFMLVGFVQFTVTVLFGSFGLFWLMNQTDFNADNQIFVGLAVSVVLIVIVFLFRKKIGELYKQWFEKLKTINRAIVMNLVLLSAGRYLVFFLQSLLMYFLFNKEVSLLLLASGISFVFLAKTIVPSMGFLGDLGVRGFSAVLFFSYFDVAALPIALASLSVWVINIFLPSFVALFLMRKISFYSRV